MWKHLIYYGAMCAGFGLSMGAALAADYPQYGGIVAGIGVAAAYCGGMFLFTMGTPK